MLDEIISLICRLIGFICSDNGLFHIFLFSSYITML